MIINIITHFYFFRCNCGFQGASLVYKNVNNMISGIPKCFVFENGSPEVSYVDIEVYNVTHCDW